MINQFKMKGQMNKHSIIILNYITLTRYAFFTALSFAIFSCSSDTTQKVVDINKIHKLVMQDEFDVAGAPNSALWGFDIGTGKNGWGNNELEYYTKRPENIIVKDGMLQITAKKESYLGSQYTSSRILTKGLFAQKYGRFEARIKMPTEREYGLHFGC